MVQVLVPAPSVPKGITAQQVQLLSLFVRRGRTHSLDTQCAEFAQLAITASKALWHL